MESENGKFLDENNFDQYSIRMNSLNKSAILKSHMLNQPTPILGANSYVNGTGNNSFTQVSLQKDLFPRTD